MRGWVTLLALLCAFQLGFGQLDTVTEASAPATSLQSRVSQVEQSLLSVANNTFQLPHLPPLQGSNKSSLLPPLPWAQPEALSDLSQAQGPATASAPEQAPIDAPAWGLAPAVAPSGADAPALAPAPAPVAGGPAATADAATLFPGLATAPSPAAAAAARSFEAFAGATGGTAAAAAAPLAAGLPQVSVSAAQPAGASSGNATASEQANAIGALVASSVRLGADLAASGHAVSLAADERASFVTKLKSDFASLSLAIANLPVGLIPFPEVAKAALQQLNADVVHGVTSGTLDINAISADREAVAAALGGIGSVGAASTENKLL